MKILLCFLISFGLSFQSISDDPIGNVIISKKSLAKRGTILIIENDNYKKNAIYEPKNDEFVGLKIIDESHLVKGMPSYIKNLRSIIEKKDLESFKKNLDKNVLCNKDGIPKSLSLGKENCISNLKMSGDQFWTHLLTTIEGGGCVIKNGFTLPSILTCAIPNDFGIQISGKIFFANTVKVYEKPLENSKFKILPQNYFIEKESLRSNSCINEGAPSNCYTKWSLIKTKITGKGYVLNKNLSKEYHYKVVIKFDGENFKITLIDSPYSLL